MDTQSQTGGPLAGLRTEKGLKEEQTSGNRKHNQRTKNLQRMPLGLWVPGGNGIGTQIREHRPGRLSGRTKSDNLQLA